MVHESISDDCVMMEKGKDDEEWMMVKCNSFEKPIVIGVVYGMQEARTPKEKVEKMWRNVTNKMIEYDKEGWDVYIGGDMNLHVGENLGLKGNDPRVSEGGKWLVDWIEDNNWALANSLYSGDCRTHVDRSSGNRKCLDLMITNQIQKVTSVNCDQEYKATPY